MVLKFNEFIEEGFMTRSLNRNKDNERRKGDGVKVHTSIGVDIFLENPGCYYKKYIRDILDYGEDPMGVLVTSVNSHSNPRKIEKGEIPYLYMLDDDFVAGFDSYEDVIDSGEIEEGEISEKDYKSIIEGIVEALKKVKFGKSKGGYDAVCHLLLISENELWGYECELSENSYYWEDFKNDFEEEFPDVEMETWSYNNYSANIGVKLNYDNLINYEDYCNFIHSYFKGLVEYEKENNEDD